MQGMKLNDNGSRIIPKWYRAGQPTGNDRNEINQYINKDIIQSILYTIIANKYIDNSIRL